MLEKSITDDVNRIVFYVDKQNIRLEQIGHHEMDVVTQNVVTTNYCQLVEHLQIIQGLRMIQKP